MKQFYLFILIIFSVPTLIYGQLSPWVDYSIKALSPELLSQNEVVSYQILHSGYTKPFEYYIDDLGYTSRTIEGNSTYYDFYFFNADKKPVNKIEYTNDIKDGITTYEYNSKGQILNVHEISSFMLGQTEYMLQFKYDINDLLMEENLISSYSKWTKKYYYNPDNKLAKAIVINKYGDTTYLYEYQNNQLQRMYDWEFDNSELTEYQYDANGYLVSYQTTNTNTNELRYSVEYKRNSKNLVTEAINLKTKESSSTYS